MTAICGRNYAARAANCLKGGFRFGLAGPFGSYAPFRSQPMLLPLLSIAMRSGVLFGPIARLKGLRTAAVSRRSDNMKSRVCLQTMRGDLLANSKIRTYRNPACPSKRQKFAAEPTWQRGTIGGTRPQKLCCTKCFSVQGFPERPVRPLAPRSPSVCRL